MKPGSPDSAQTIQRVRVGMTGLAMVVVLIALASWVGNSVNRETAVSAVGGANTMVVANMTDPGNTLIEKGKDEPLAELGAAPSTSDGAAAKQDAARREQR